MRTNLSIPEIQKLLSKHSLDGWLLYDFHGSNPFAHELLSIPQEIVLTRRFFYFIPRQGEPVKILHRIEADSLEGVPGETKLYLSWVELEQVLKTTLEGKKTIAMEYSSRCSNPYVSVVDAGTIELIRGLGVQVVSSADLLQALTSVLDQEQMQTHLHAASVLTKTVDRVWDLISDRLRLGKPVTEYDVQQFILSEFLAKNCITEDGPICAVNGNSAFPHYMARKETSRRIHHGDFILIDLWCKTQDPYAIYADITRVAVAASVPTPRQEEIFQIVKGSMDAGIQLIESRMKEGKPLTGAEVDDCCRGYIRDKGYGEFFPHRTGHNIGVRVHGAGAHLDNLETADHRQILPGTCFSLEPGIYLPNEFGVRIECDVLIHLDRSVHITGGKEESIVCLL